MNIPLLQSVSRLERRLWREVWIAGSRVKRSVLQLRQIPGKGVTIQIRMVALFCKGFFEILSMNLACSILGLLIIVDLCWDGGCESTDL